MTHPNSLQRRFDASPHKTATTPLHRFDSFDSFLSSPAKAGISEIPIGPRPIHALFEDRGNPVTLVHFMAALPNEGWETFPTFGGKKLSAGFPVNRLSLSDPNIALPGKPPTGWYLGTHDQPLQDILSKVIAHYVASSTGKQTVLFGSSAGGFAALTHGAHLPDSVTICVNPRTDLLRLPSQIQKLAKTSFPSANIFTLADSVKTSAGFSYRDSPGNTVAYLQNAKDRTYFEGGLIPFLGLNSADSRIHLRIIDSGPGHRMPTGGEIEETVGALVEHAPNWSGALSDIGYFRAPTVDAALATRNEIALDP